MKIEYSPQAVSDLDSITEYITLQLENPQAASSITEKIGHSVSLLKSLPNMGGLLSVKVGSIPEKYRYIISGNYIVIYFVDDETIKIVRIYDGRTNWINTLHL